VATKKKNAMLSVPGLAILPGVLVAGGIAACETTGVVLAELQAPTNTTSKSNNEKKKVPLINLKLTLQVIRILLKTELLFR
jgi:hypothetical protein